MTGNASWVPQGIDTTKASAARVYDWWLGGEHNFRVDEDAARALISVDPRARVAVRATRGFLIRAVRYLAAEAGIRQFLDIGSGIPTEQNVHEVAQAVDPDAKVVYVDNDDVAVAHSRAVLLGNPNATVIHADIRDAQKILDHPETRRMLDFTQPVGLVISAILHFIPDSDDPDGLLATLRAPLAPGSYLAVSHSCGDADTRTAGVFASSYTKRVKEEAVIRSGDDIMRFFEGTDLIEPGLVWTHEWRPDSPPDVPEGLSPIWAKAGVGKVREGAEGGGTAGLRRSVRHQDLDRNGGGKPDRETTGREHT